MGRLRAEGREWPGYEPRFCPVCNQKVGTHREPTNDERLESVVYHQHWDTIGKTCRMSNERAAIRAVAFTVAPKFAPWAAIA